MITFAIITPSYKRFSFIKKLVGMVAGQTYPNWTLYVVHDGPSAQYSRFFSKTTDSRVKFYELDAPARDWGYSPRLKAMQMCDKSPQTYCVLWDDDNYYPATTLETFAEELATHGYPDYLIAHITAAGICIPDMVTSVDQVHSSQIDTACLVMKADVGLLHATKIGSQGKNPGEDRKLFLSLRSDESLRGVVSQKGPLILYDGARPLQNLRWKLGIPRLGLSELKIYRDLRAFLRRL